MQDIRRIIFSNHELFCAFESYSWRMPDFLPPGKLVSCTPIGRPGIESEIIIRIRTDPEDPSKEKELTYRGAKVLQPLILFCLENNVSLPRDGRKAFLVVESQANLIVDLNMDCDLVFEEAPMTSEDVDHLKDEPK